MPPRAAAKTRTTAVKAVVEPQPDPEETAEDPAVDEDGPLILTSSTEEEKPAVPVEVFRIDGRPWFINAANPVQVVLKAMHATHNDQTMPGFMEFIKLTAGSDALMALLNHKDINEITIARVARKIMDIVQGEAGPGKP